VSGGVADGANGANAALGWYVPGASWLHRLDPRPKLVFVALGTIVVVSLVSIPALLAMLVGLHVALLSAGVPGRRVLGLWRLIAPLLLIILLVQPLLSPAGPPLVTIWIVRITPLGVALGVALALRLAATGFCWYALLLTTREPDLVQGLVRLGMPNSWGLVLALALRYPSTVRDVYFTARDAQRSRGLRLEGRGLIGRTRAQLPVLIAMLVATLRSIEHLAMALEARGFGGPARRTSLRALHMRRLDWVVLALVVAAAGAALAARLRLGFETGPLDGWPR
jgi:energy-coupling factor transport system permease protein